MTGSQKEMLVAFADGADVNLTAQLARLAGKREEHNCARTVMALLRAKMLQPSKSGGLEISEAGREAAAKIKKAKPRMGAK